MVNYQIDAEEDLLAENQRLRDRLSRFERNGGFGLVWENIPEAVEQQLVDEVPVLKHIPSLDVDGAKPSPSPHVLIEGDNLHALHVLQATHRGKVDAIYIDPPYNTGKEFIYNDRLIDAESEYRHSAWLSFMEKRLRLARELLKDTGVIAISIDDNEQANLRLLCENIFGPSNFIAQLIWSGRSGGQDAKTFNRLHEYVLIFAKDISVVTIRPELSEADLSKYPMIDIETQRRYKRQLARKWGSNSLRTDRPNLFYAVIGPDGTQCWPLRADGKEGCWRWSANHFKKEMEEGNVEFLKNSGGQWVAYQRMWSPVEGFRLARPHSTLVPTETGTTANGSRELKSILGNEHGFDYPKPSNLIQWVLSCIADASALILDFFAGSGTTLHAVAELNMQDGGSRRCILVTNNENDICREVTQPRVKAVLTGDWASGKHDPLPGSLEFYTTDFFKRSESLDQMRADIAEHTVDLIAIKDGAIKKSSSAGLHMLYGDHTTIAVVTAFDIKADALTYANNAVRDGDSQIAYLFTWSDHGIESELVDMWTGWDVHPLPAEMVAALRRLAPKKESL